MEQPKLHLVETVQGINCLIKALENVEFVAFDVETTGLTTQHEIIGYSICYNETSAHYVVLSKYENGKLVYLSGMKEASQHLIELLATKELIMHNSVFDCQMTQAFFKVDLMKTLAMDTMIAAHLTNENRRIGLKELAKQYFSEDATKEQVEMKASVIANGGKTTKGDYEMFKAEYTILGKYGAKDAWLTYQIAGIVAQELIDQKLDKFFYEDESMPLLKTVTYELNTTGLQIDTKKLSELKNTLKAECAKAKDFITNEIVERVKFKYPGTSKKNTFNLGSNPQLSWLLFDVYKLEFGTLTKEGKTVCKAMGLKLPYSPAAKREFIARGLARTGEIYQPAATVNGKPQRAKKIKEPWNYIACDKKVMSKYANTYEWIKVLLEHNRKLKLLNTYVEGIEERIMYGVIYSQFKQTGTTSGRYSSSNPNFQNLPRDDKRIKECVVARPGKVFVGADYSQLEPRVFAYTSQDRRLMEAFNGDDDFYSVIGIQVFDKYDAEPKKEGSENAFGVKYKKLRDLSKVIALASTYGATAFQLSPTTGKNSEDTQEIIDQYFERFPNVAKMMLESHEQAKAHGQVVNMFGRPRRMPEAKKIKKLYGNISHAELPYEVRNLLNLAVNHRIQSTGASIVNRAAIEFKRLCSEAGIECKIVCQVHDSLVIECKEADGEDVAALLQHSMTNTTILPGVPLEAVPKIGKNLSEV